MADGKAPVVPNNPSEKYHLHHVGQQAKVFAIIPENDHLGPLNSSFHFGSSGQELHGPEFEALKKKFWLAYLSNMSEYHVYAQIPYYKKEREVIL